MTDLSKSISQTLSDVAKSLPQRPVRIATNKPSWWKVWRIRQRRQKQRIEKLMNIMINRPEVQSEVHKKLREFMHHELTCGELSHMHGVSYTYWDDETSTTFTDLQPSDPETNKRKAKATK